MSQTSTIRIVGATATARHLTESGLRALAAEVALSVAGNIVVGGLLDPTHHSDTGTLAAAMRAPVVTATNSGCTFSLVYPDYAGYVVNGTKRQSAEPPTVNRYLLTSTVQRTVGPYVAKGRV